MCMPPCADLALASTVVDSFPASTASWGGKPGPPVPGDAHCPSPEQIHAEHKPRSGALPGVSVYTCDLSEVSWFLGSGYFKASFWQ